MADALLDTKFGIPGRRRGQIARPRLREQLDRAWDSALTLVSAPAGFGKTTLVADWLASVSAPGRYTAWLALDGRDNDPVIFWTYVVTAVNRVIGAVGAPALLLLTSPRPPLEAVLSSLINDLNACPDDVVVVLDDYHLIDAAGVQAGIAFLLDHFPAHLHLVIAGRADPPLSLARLRSRGELVELRAADLRFRVDETGAYLNQVMGLALTDEQVAVLDGRTEGWIAALQLAALSLQGRPDVGAFLAGFAGDDRYIVDYLVDEVLVRQPAAVREFLLQTSILDRLSGSLCDAVTRRGGGKAMLANLERGNLFLVPLDERREWYRYHQLFADVLRTHLWDEHPDDVPALHRRAGDWYEQQGQLFESVGHAVAAADHEHAADLVERAIPSISRNRQEAAVLSWLQVIPDAVVRVRPVLMVGFAGALLSGGRFDGVAARLDDAQRWLDRPHGAEGADASVPGMVVVDPEQFRGLPKMIELYRAALALRLGDLPGTVRHARRAVDLSEGDHLGLAAAAGLLGLASWTSGNLPEAHAAYTECSAGLLQAGYVSDTLGCAIALADIRLAQGRLRSARSTFELALRRAAAAAPAGPGVPLLRGTADMHVGLSAIHLEQGDLGAAREELRRSRECGDRNGLPQHPYRWRVATALIEQADGELDEALRLLAEAEQVYVGDFFPCVRPIPALRARVWIRQQRWADAAGWAQDAGLTTGDDLHYLREFEHITLAGMLLARLIAAADAASDGPAHGRATDGPAVDARLADELTAFLERLRRAAQDGGRAGSVLEILLLQAVHHRHSDPAAALIALQGALELAEPEGYLQIFVAAGAPMSALFRAAPARLRIPERISRLRTGATDAMTTVGGLAGGALPEPLTPRERDVLRLLGTELDGPDIALRLFVSLNTLRTHTRNIYAKLGVTSRRAAVRRATELALLAPADTP